METNPMTPKQELKQDDFPNYQAYRLALDKQDSACVHMYSRSISEPRLRKCIHCGETDLKGVSTQDIPKEFAETINKNWDKLMEDSAHTEDLMRELIKKHLEGWHGLERASIQHFYESGKVSGSLFLALKAMMTECASGNPLPTEGQTTEINPLPYGNSSSVVADASGSSQESDEDLQENISDIILIAKVNSQEEAEALIGRQFDIKLKV